MHQFTLTLQPHRGPLRRHTSTARGLRDSQITKVFPPSAAIGSGQRTYSPVAATTAPPTISAQAAASSHDGAASPRATSSSVDSSGAP